MLVTIIVPARNAGKTISQCVNSIYNNRHVEIECIVVINNSNDDTLKQCKKLKEKYRSLVIVESCANGVSAARNVGLQRATGEIIGFCDADDYLEPNAIDEIVAKMRQSDIDIEFVSFFRVIKRGNKLERERSRCAITNRIVSAKKARGYVLNDPGVTGSVWNKFYKREVITGIWFDEELTHCEDTHFNMLVLKRNRLRILFSDFVAYNYVVNPKSATMNKDELFSSDNTLRYLTSMKKIKNEYAENIRVRLEVSYEVLRLCVDNYVFCGSAAARKKLRIEILKSFWAILVGFAVHCENNNMALLKNGMRILAGFI